MTDREMLELAAKAGGYARHEYVENSARDGRVVTGHYDSLLEVCINPRTDDGDALRLAVDLRFETDVTDSGVAVRTKCGLKVLVSTKEEPDLRAAARLAIFHAAVEIGRQMEEASNG